MEAGLEKGLAIKTKKEKITRERLTSNRHTCVVVNYLQESSAVKAFEADSIVFKFFINKGISKLQVELSYLIANNS